MQATIIIQIHVDVDDERALKELADSKPLMERICGCVQAIDGIRADHAAIQVVGEGVAVAAARG